MTAADALAAYLADKRALLILDNCEHVLDAAAALADRLVAHVSVAACSGHQPPTPRPARRVTWRVPSLAVPTIDRRRPAGSPGCPACEAVQLFVERAGRARPGFAVTDANAQRWPTSAGVWTASRWPSSWPPPGSGSSPRPRSPRPRRALRAAHRRAPHRPAPPADPGSLRRLVPPPAHRRGTAVLPPPGRLRRRLRLRRRPDGVRRPTHRNPTRSSTCSPCWSTSRLVDVDDSGAVARYRLLETVRAYAWVRLEGSSGSPGDPRPPPQPLPGRRGGSRSPPRGPRPSRMDQPARPRLPQPARRSVLEPRAG